MPRDLKSTARRRRQLAALIVLLLATSPPFARGDETQRGEQRFLIALAKAMECPEARAIAYRQSSRRLGQLAERRSGAPALEWQSEGLMGDGREPNAVDSLRFRSEFSWAGQRRALEDFAETAGAAERTSIDAELTALRLQTGRMWLGLAAMADEALVYERRAARLRSAVALHEKRHELGEVAGAEVKQLALERARDEVEKQRLEARRAALDAELTRWIGAAPRPVAGDLVTLLEGLPPVEQDLGSPADPLVRAAESEMLRAEKLGRLDAALAAGRPAGEFELQHIPAVDGRESFESFSLQLSVPLNLGVGVRERRAAALARADGARTVLEAEKERSRSRIERALGTLRAAEASLASISALLEELPRTEHSLAEQFRLGAISYFVYLDGLDRLDQLRLDAARGRGELARARFELALLTADPTLFPLPRGPVAPKENSP